MPGPGLSVPSGGQQMGRTASERPHYQPSLFHTQSHEGKPGDLFVSAVEWKSVCVWRWGGGWWCQMSSAQTATV